MTIEKARKLRRLIEQAAETLPDEEAIDITDAFPLWKIGTVVLTGTRYNYCGTLYRCEQAHTTQAGWEPPNVPALWTEIAKPGEIPVWRQPTGAQDAYMTGDKVHYPDENGPVYVSTVDNNVWAPNVYGWTLEG